MYIYFDIVYQETFGINASLFGMHDCYKNSLLYMVLKFVYADKGWVKLC